MLRLVVQFRAIGWQWPINDGDCIRVDRGPETICTLSGELVRSLLLHYVAGADLTGQVVAEIAQSKRVATGRPFTERKPLMQSGQYDAERRAELRAARRSRR